MAHGIQSLGYVAPFGFVGLGDTVLPELDFTGSKPDYSAPSLTTPTGAVKPAGLALMTVPGLMLGAAGLFLAKKKHPVAGTLLTVLGGLSLFSVVAVGVTSNRTVT